MKVKAAFMFFLIFSSPAFSGFTTAGAGWRGVAEKIEHALKDSLKSYEKGDTDSAMDGVADAYFEIFESEGANMEIAVRQSLSLKRATSLERAFTDIRKMMNEKVPLKAVKGHTLDLIAEIKKAADELDGKGVDTGGRQ